MYLLNNTNNTVSEGEGKGEEVGWELPVNEVYGEGERKERTHSKIYTQFLQFS